MLTQQNFQKAATGLFCQLTNATAWRTLQCFNNLKITGMLHWDVTHAYLKNGKKFPINQHAASALP